MSNDKKKPAHEIRMGTIKATIWHNETESGSSRHNVQIRRLYRDDQAQEWKTSDSFGRDDLLLVAKVLDMAHSWIFERVKNEV